MLLMFTACTSCNKTIDMHQQKEGWAAVDTVLKHCQAGSASAAASATLATLLADAEVALPVCCCGYAAPDCHKLTKSAVCKEISCSTAACIPVRARSTSTLPAALCLTCPCQAYTPQD